MGQGAGREQEEGGRGEGGRRKKVATKAREVGKEGRKKRKEGRRRERDREAGRVVVGTEGREGAGVRRRGRRGGGEQSASPFACSLSRLWT